MPPKAIKKKVAPKALFKLKREMGNNFRTNVLLTNRLFDCLIKPILLYGSEIWGVDEIKNEHDPIELVHAKFCKFILGVGKYAPNIGCRAELGRYPLSIDAKLRVLSFHNKRSEAHRNFLSHDAYLDCTPGTYTYNWYVKGKAMVSSVGLGFLWGNFQVIEKKAQQYLFKQRLQDIEFQNFEAGIFNDSKKPGQKNKLRTYCKFKTKYDKEMYLVNVQNIKHREELTRLRIISCLKLEIEAGRYSRPYRSPEERLCRQCDLNETDDEWHFLLRCPIYDNLRKEMLDVLEKDKIRFHNKEQLFHLLLNPPKRYKRLLQSTFFCECV
ncbi:uncharacterized protein LOC5516904 isoform X3 [Nematostella vectensis]|uniref:uncharacterized protein LOC5516904 isoform X3 n=1 Tax=Nematostella vectensis TaxID=45351 RepID=UPI0020773B5C|nr:uncharacterized protein LOC5516904 isoform X3 [Nematostella vectensis]